MDTAEPHQTVYVTPAIVRKLARLTQLHDESAVIELSQFDDRNGYHVQVEWLDEYGSRVRDGSGRKDGHAAVIRENGWSNPPVARLAEKLAPHCWCGTPKRGCSACGAR